MTMTIKRRAEAVHDSVPPSRAGSPLAVRSGGGVRSGITFLGAVGWERNGKNRGKVVEVNVPFSDDDLSVAVRVHELIHAAHPHPKRLPKVSRYAQEAAADIFVQREWWPDNMPTATSQAVGRAAMHELENLQEPTTADSYNSAVVCLARSLAALQRLTCYTGYTTVPYLPLLPLSLHGVEGGIRRILSRRRPTMRWLCLKLAELMVPDEIASDQCGRAPTKEHREATAADPMPTVELERPVACDASATALVGARSGVRIRRGRLAAAVANMRTTGLFLRRKLVAPAGTWLFDASGSMGVGDTTLASVCSAAPGAVVAYYSDYHWDCPIGRHGTLCVFARDGRRADKIANRGGGNGCDYWAADWLLKQPSPRYLVSDLGFCDGPVWQAVLANQLVDDAVKEGLLTVIESVDKALELLGHQK